MASIGVFTKGITRWRAVSQQVSKTHWSITADLITIGAALQSAKSIKAQHTIINP